MHHHSILQHHAREFSCVSQSLWQPLPKFPVRGSTNMVPSWDSVFWIPPVSWLSPLTVPDHVNTVLFPFGLEQTSDHQSSLAAWASWQSTSSPSTLGREANVVGHVCYLHKYPISNRTAVNPESSLLQHQSACYNCTLCLPAWRYNLTLTILFYWLTVFRMKAINIDQLSRRYCYMIQLLP